MPTFQERDGARLAYRLIGEGEPLICLPGGPMLASAYPGDLGQPPAHRSLVLLDFRATGESAVPDDPQTYRCDRPVDAVEALREHLGQDEVEILAHSAVRRWPCSTSPATHGELRGWPWSLRVPGRRRG